MIGEDEGDVTKAYKEFYDAVLAFDNVELLPVKNSTLRIDPNNVNQDSESVKRLDYLVDYYQSGLSMQIEAIFRGHGHLEILEMENAMNIYEKIQIPTRRASRTGLTFSGQSNSSSIIHTFWNCY